MTDPRDRRVLCIFPQLTSDLAKSAHLLILRNAVPLGCHAVVLTVGSAEHEAGAFDSVWKGIYVRRLVPHSMRWRVLQRLYQWRRVSGKQGLSRVLARVGRPLLLPVTTLLSFPDAHAAATEELVAEAISLHRVKPFDAILTLYYPLTAHFVGQQVSRDLKLPWIALTKDFYSWPDSLRHGRVKRLVNRLKRWYEPKAYANASVVVSISTYMNEYLQALTAGVPQEVLSHCFDEQAYPAPLPRSAGPRPMTLVCVGLTQQRDIPALKTLFQAVAMLVEQDGFTAGDLALRFVGHNGHLVQQVAREFAVEALVTTVAAVDHAAAMRELKQADCLFYMQTPFGTRRRLTEYLGARRPVLAYPSFPGEFSEILLTESGVGRIADSSEQIAETIREMVDEFKRHGDVQVAIDEQYVRQHSAEHRAGELVAILDRYAPRDDSTSRPTGQTVEQRS